MLIPRLLRFNSRNIVLTNNLIEKCKLLNANMLHGNSFFCQPQKQDELNLWIIVTVKGKHRHLAEMLTSKWVAFVHFHISCPFFHISCPLDTSFCIISKRARSGNTGKGLLATLARLTAHALSLAHFTPCMPFPEQEELHFVFGCAEQRDTLRPSAFSAFWHA